MSERVLASGTIIDGKYVVEGVLGEGGFGITYLAKKMDSGERVAVKEYFPSEWATRLVDSGQIIPSSKMQEGFYQHGRQVFINEARVLSQLKDVSNVVNVRALFEENGTAYMVMDLLEGHTLNAYLKLTNSKNMPYQNANKIILAVGMALHQVHKQMLLHRDVSPDNIIITKSGQVYLIDFGATRMYALNSPKSMSVLVKPGFAPIEQYSRAGNQGPWTDVYALAATYYYLVVGRKPPEAPDRIAGSKVTSLKDAVGDVPEFISDAVDHALEEQWRDRPQSIRDFMLEMGLVKPRKDLPPTVWNWPRDRGNTIERMESTSIRKPCVLMQTGNRRQRYYFADDGTLSIGKTVGETQGNVQITDDKQVSRLHCKLWYDEQSGRFAIQNYSANRTYTSQGILDKDQTSYLIKGEWLYIQTMKDRYIFYLEVE